MSVVNTHLVAGAALVVTDLGMDDRPSGRWPGGTA
jgi:hypothetical protein